MLQQIEHSLNQILAPLGVKIYFGKEAIEDLSGYKKDTIRNILALIVAMARKGSLLKPDGLGHPLHGELAGFAKIKPKNMALRIVYRPIPGKVIRMEIIAIGPKNREEVYIMAAARVAKWNAEMANRP